MAIEQFLDTEQKAIRSMFVSSYVPRKCGIATFTKDLTKALNDLNPEALAEIIALDTENSGIYYPWEVKYHIIQNNLDNYFQAAEYVNQSSADIVCLQHEYGLFGGDGGEHIVNFLRQINKPAVVTLHTVMENPNEIQRSVLQRVAEFSKILVVMIPEARRRLEESYGIDPKKVIVIQHGVPDCPKSDKGYKRLLKWEDKRVILSAGLIGPDKGLEYAISAMPEIIKEIPQAYLYIVGQTHPVIFSQVGEKYRQELVGLAKKLGVSDRVRFINRYLPLPSLIRYYEACDVFITPHINPGQISSGTLAYALGMGKPCISTPYLYAKEVLSNGRGELVEFRSGEEIAQKAIKILSDEKYEKELSDNTYRIGRFMSWPRIAQRYLNLFRYVIGNE